MKVILIKDVKGKGKANETINVAGGYANYLIASNLAVPDTVENQKVLANKLANDIETEKARVLKAREVADEIARYYNGFCYMSGLSPKGTLINGYTKTMLEKDLASRGIKNCRVEPFDPIITLGLNDITINVDNRAKVTIQIRTMYDPEL